MRQVAPSVRLISSPSVDFGEVASYLEEVGGEAWLERIFSSDDIRDGEVLVEFSGRACYRSWTPGLNPNVSKVREDSFQYLQNVMSSYHGSVLEHANFTFILHNVSRVFTHEHVRHRAGAAYSQESMRFVRLTDIPFWFPEWAKDDPELMKRCERLLQVMENHQIWMAEHFGLDEEGVPFAEKKHKTSFMRRFAPDGVATGIVFTGNIRTLRHTIEMRTASGAEEEIRLVFDKIAEIMLNETPSFFADFKKIPVEDSDIPAWVPMWRKV